LNNPDYPWLWRIAGCQVFNGSGSDDGGTGNGVGGETDSDVHVLRSKAQRKLPKGYGVLIVNEQFNSTDEDSSGGLISGAACRFLMKLP
jgi:hypothetical protein